MCRATVPQISEKIRGGNDMHRLFMSPLPVPAFLHFQGWNVDRQCLIRDSLYKSIREYKRI